MRFTRGKKRTVQVFAVGFLLLSGCGKKPEKQDAVVKDKSPSKPSAYLVVETPRDDTADLQSATAAEYSDFRLRCKEAIALVKDFRHEDAGAVLAELTEEVRGTDLQPAVERLTRIISRDYELFMIIEKQMPLPEGGEFQVAAPDGKSIWTVTAVKEGALFIKTGGGGIKRLTWDQVPPETQYQVIARLIDRTDVKQQMRMIPFCYLRGLESEAENEINASITAIGYPDPVEKEVNECRELFGKIFSEPGAEPPAKFSVEPSVFKPPAGEEAASGREGYAAITVNVSASAVEPETVSAGAGIPLAETRVPLQSQAETNVAVVATEIDMGTTTASTTSVSASSIPEASLDEMIDKSMDDALLDALSLEREAEPSDVLKERDVDKASKKASKPTTERKSGKRDENPAAPGSDFPSLLNNGKGLIGGSGGGGGASDDSENIEMPPMEDLLGEDGLPENK